jgi:hypothetical protein
MDAVVTRLVTVRRLELGELADRFDRDEWARIAPSERLARVWEMVLEYQSWRDSGATEQGLQRSVCRVERSGG